MEKLVITVALTGDVPTQQMSPNLPVTAAQISADEKRCRDAEACLFHVHARDADQKPTLDINVYKANVRAIKASAPDVIIQLSTGARRQGLGGPHQARAAAAGDGILHHRVQ